MSSERQIVTSLFSHIGVFSQSLSTVVTWDSFWCCLFLVLLISVLLFNFDCLFADRWPQPSQIDPSHSLILPLASGFHTACSLPWASPCHPTPFRINTLYPIGSVSVCFGVCIFIQPLGGWVYNGDKVSHTQSSRYLLCLGETPNDVRKWW